MFLSGLDVFGSVLHRVDDDAWDRVSPCQGWTARDLAGHVVAMLDMGNAILAGEPPTWPRSSPGRSVSTESTRPSPTWSGGGARTVVIP